MHPQIKHTIDIAEKMYANLPPLVPENIVEDMGAALEQLKASDSLSLEQVEETIVSFAKHLWPYRQAFEEIYALYEKKLAEKLFLQKSSPRLRKTYERFLETGGTFADLKRGSSAHFFSVDERVELHRILVDVVCDIQGFARQAVLHTDRALYEERIHEFTGILEEIEQTIEGLRAVADNEREHPQLVSEIQRHIQGFEHSIALLGPSVDLHAVCNAHEHIAGRKYDLKLRV